MFASQGQRQRAMTTTTRDFSLLTLLRSGHAFLIGCGRISAVRLDHGDIKGLRIVIVPRAGVRLAFQ